MHTSGITIYLIMVQKLYENLDTAQLYFQALHNCKKDMNMDGNAEGDWGLTLEVTGRWYLVINCRILSSVKGTEIHNKCRDVSNMSAGCAVWKGINLRNARPLAHRNSFRKRYQTLNYRQHITDSTGLVASVVSQVGSMWWSFFQVAMLRCNSRLSSV